MGILDDIRDGKGLKPITYNCFTCQNDNCIVNNEKIATYQCPDYKHKKTNADRIHNMTDEEMATWIYMNRWNDIESLLEWLKQKYDS